MEQAVSQEQGLIVYVKTCVDILGQAYLGFRALGMPLELAKDFSVQVLRIIIDQVSSTSKEKPSDVNLQTLMAMLTGGKLGQ